MTISAPAVRVAARLLLPAAVAVVAFFLISLFDGRARADSDLPAVARPPAALPHPATKPADAAGRLSLPLTTTRDLGWRDTPGRTEGFRSRPGGDDQPARGDGRSGDVHTGRAVGIPPVAFLRPPPSWTEPGEADDQETPPPWLPPVTPATGTPLSRGPSRGADELVPGQAVGWVTNGGWPALGVSPGGRVGEAAARVPDGSAGGGTDGLLDGADGPAGDVRSSGGLAPADVAASLLAGTAASSGGLTSVTVDGSIAASVDGIASVMVDRLVAASVDGLAGVTVDGFVAASTGGPASLAIVEGLFVAGFDALAAATVDVISAGTADGLPLVTLLGRTIPATVDGFAGGLAPVVGIVQPASGAGPGTGAATPGGPETAAHGLVHALAAGGADRVVSTAVRPRVAPPAWPGAVIHAWVDAPAAGGGGTVSAPWPPGPSGGCVPAGCAHTTDAVNAGGQPLVVPAPVALRPDARGRLVAPPADVVQAGRRPGAAPLPG